MAASGFTPISLYYSTTASAVPTSGNLANGELALNIADMKLYAKNSAGTVTLLASSGGAAGTVSSVAVSGGTTGLTTSGGPITTSGTITLAGTLATANGGTNLTSFTSGGVVYASSTSALATGSALTFDGTNLGLGSSTINTYYNRTQQIYGTASSSLKLTNATAGTANTDGFDVALNGVDAFVINRESGPLYFGTNNTTQATIDSAGLLGLGITPVGNAGNGRSIEISYAGTIHADAGNPNTAIASSAYRFDNDWKYKNGSFAPTRYTQGSGIHTWFTAPVGTTGNTISFTQAMTLEGTDRANLLVGTTSTSFSAATRGVIEIAGSSTALVSLKAGSALAYIYNDGSTLNIQNNSVGVLQLSTNSALRFQIGASGQFGIGGATYGTAGQVLTSGGSGAAPTWATAGGGGAWTYISTTTCSNSVYAIVTWTSTENALYDMMVIVATNVQCDQSNVAMFSQFYIGGTVDANSQYAYVAGYPSPSWVAVSNTSGSASSMQMSQGSAFTGSAANNASWTIYIPAPGNSAQYPNMFYTGSMNRNNSGPLLGNGQTNYSTGTTTGMRFFTGGNYFTTGTFRLYGIKKS